MVFNNVHRGVKHRGTRAGGRMFGSIPRRFLQVKAAKASSVGRGQVKCMSWWNFGQGEFGFEYVNCDGDGFVMIC